MDPVYEPNIKALSRFSRTSLLWSMFAVFVIAIPFLYLYATGYRLDLKNVTNFVSTGGLFVSTEQTGVEIYIDDELVRETRRFNKAFYAQNIDPATHKVHVQKDGYHTWVKELPVYPHLVTEVEVFNLPLVPVARIITQYATATGTPVLFEGATALASTTQTFYATTTKQTKKFLANAEFAEKKALFGISTTSTNRAIQSRVESLFVQQVATSTQNFATSTKEWMGVELSMMGENVVATWKDSREEMPYYYCAIPFPRIETNKSKNDQPALAIDSLLVKEDGDSIPPAQRVEVGAVCNPTISIDRKNQKVSYFDFFPGNSDIVVMGLEDGIYAVEIDDRSWQNMQPILLGRNLSTRIENGRVIVYDGTQFYEMVLE